MVELSLSIIFVSGRSGKPEHTFSIKNIVRVTHELIIIAITESDDSVHSEHIPGE